MEWWYQCQKILLLLIFVSYNKVESLGFAQVAQTAAKLAPKVLSEFLS